MIHHFEKGRREPSLEDLFKLMNLAGDNIRGLIEDLVKDKKFAKHFPKGKSTTYEEWSRYWEKPYIAAMRQIMRTDYYRKLKAIKKGFFTKILPINLEQEEEALRI